MDRPRRDLGEDIDEVGPGVEALEHAAPDEGEGGGGGAPGNSDSGPLPSPSKRSFRRLTNFSRISSNRLAGESLISLSDAIAASRSARRSRMRWFSSKTAAIPILFV